MAGFFFYSSTANIEASIVKTWNIKEDDSYVSKKKVSEIAPKFLVWI